MTACHAPNLPALIDRAQSDLFAAAAKDQRAPLAEAWGNFRCGVPRHIAATTRSSQSCSRVPAAAPEPRASR